MVKLPAVPSGSSICRKVARKVATGDSKRTTVSLRNLEELLGPPRFTRNLAEEHDEPGIATGVSWRPAGGDVMTVEVSLREGKGQLVTTGQLGDVMKESAQAALSYARLRAADLGRDLLLRGCALTADLRLRLRRRVAELPLCGGDG